MRYFIGHMLTGPVAEYHRALVRDVATRFDLKIPAGIFPSHVTFKEPFQIGNVAPIKNVIEKIASEYSSLPFTISDFGHFDSRVIFLNIVPANDMARCVSVLQHALMGLPWMPWGMYEPLIHLHVTIAKNNITGKFGDIWEYLVQKDAPQFDLSFNNLTLFRREEHVWVADCVRMLSA